MKEDIERERADYERERERERAKERQQRREGSRSIGASTGPQYRERDGDMDGIVVDDSDFMLHRPLRQPPPPPPAEQDSIRTRRCCRGSPPASRRTPPSWRRRGSPHTSHRIRDRRGHPPFPPHQLSADTSRGRLLLKASPQHTRYCRFQKQRPTWFGTQLILCQSIPQSPIFIFIFIFLIIFIRE